MCSKITGDIQFFLIMHTVHVLLLNILRSTAPCCTISEDQNQWKIKLKAGNDDSCVLFTSGLYSGMHSFAYRLAFIAVTRNITTLNLLHTKIFNLSGFQKCAKFYTHKFFIYTVNEDCQSCRTGNH